MVCIPLPSRFFLLSETDLFWIRDLIQSWFEVKIRGLVGPDLTADKSIVILGRRVYWTSEGVEFESDSKHRDAILEYFGFSDYTKALVRNGGVDPKFEVGESTAYWFIAAKGNFMGQDCPHLRFLIKCCSQDMGTPTLGAWKRVKRTARFILGIDRVVWK